ncbi:hypothetical protein [Streptomyces sp. NPDC000405]|uniref:hypothetical protein n=1 Tax=Streptomyces sp. NPDC000405 TaxID=3161033 RepID=UPI00398CAB83
MSTALLAAIAGISGIALGRLWDGWSETSRWRRDQKTASYQRLAEAFILLYEDLRSIALAESGTGAFVNATERGRQNKIWDNALVAVWLHGSASVVRAASSMDRAVTELFYDAQASVYSLEDWNRARVPSADAFEAFIAATRKELGLPPAPIKLFPYAPN